MILAALPWLLLLLQAALLGAGAFRAALPRSLSLGERWCFGLALGLGLDAYLILALGLLGLLYPWAILSAIVTATVIAYALGGHALIAETLRARRPPGGSRASGGRRPADPSGSGMVPETLWAGACLVLCLLGVVAAAAPPSSLDWDGLSYHLAVPKLYLAHHRIFFIPYDHHSNFPFTVEMLFTLGLALGSTSLAVLFHTAYGALTAAALWLAWRRLRGRGSWLPGLLFLSSPMVLWELGVSYIDLAVALYLLLAFLGVAALMPAPQESLPVEDAKTRGREGGQTIGGPAPLGAESEAGDATRWLVLSGLCAGLAVACKTTAVVPVFFLAVGAAWLVLRGRATGAAGEGPRPSVAGLAASLAAAVIVASPWYVKTYLYTGNPVYPFLYSVFGGVNWSPELARLYSQEQAGFGAGRGAADLLLLPWRLAFAPHHFLKGLGFLGSTGVAFLGLLPLLGLTRRVDPRVAAGLWLCAAVGVPWFLSSQQSRYLLPLFPLLALGAAFPLLAPELPAAARRWGAGFALGAACLSGLLYARAVVIPAAPAAFGVQSADAYLHRTLDLWPAVRFVNERLPRGAKLLLFDETRGFYFDREYVWANPGHSTLIPYHRFRTAQEMVGWFRSRGFTHAVINQRHAGREWGRSAWERLILRAVEEGLLRPLFAERGVQVFVLGG